MDMVCKCGGKEFFTEEHGNQTGLYCSACGKWQKWLKKDEIRLFNHGMIPSHDVAMQIEGFQNASLLNGSRLVLTRAQSKYLLSKLRTPT